MNRTLIFFEMEGPDVTRRVSQDDEPFPRNIAFPLISQRSLSRIQIRRLRIEALSGLRPVRH